MMQEPTSEKVALSEITDPEDRGLLTEVRKVKLNTEVLKWASLGILWVQNCCFWLLSFYTRQFPSDGHRYLSSTIVVVIELVKIAACTIAICVSDGGLSGLQAAIKKDIVDDPWTTLKVGFPAFAYTISNNCLFLATLYIDASTAQILYNGKLLATAACSVVILQMTISIKKWACLVVLTLGAMAVQMNAVEKAVPMEGGGHNPLTGLMVIAVGCMMSSTAGVYFEKFLKGSSTSIWMRNVQLGIFSVLVGSIGVWWRDADAVREGGFFQGYTTLTWVLVANQAVGGLLVAFACKYANNIWKNFACTLSIILSSLAIWVFFPVYSPISGLFCLGAVMVLGSTFLYGREDAREKVEREKAQLQKAEG